VKEAYDRLALRGRFRFASLVAAFACVLGLVACGGGGGDDIDVDSLTSCLEDAGLKVEKGDVGNDEADKGITDELSVKAADDNPLEGAVGVQMAVFDSSDQAENYFADSSGDLQDNLKQVGSSLIFALDNSSKEYGETVFCAEDATG
jgi:hypothetical protein